MDIKKTELQQTVFNNSPFPEPIQGEIAFAGRSNVGKSSLLNALFQRKIAKTSSKPGKTASINFYRVNDLHFFVDLPGYGFAKVPFAEKNRWAKLVDRYFSSRIELSITMILMDARNPLLENDWKLIEWISSHQIPYGFVLTKADKLSKSGIARQVEWVKKQLQERGDFMIFPVSATKRTGLGPLLDFLFEVIA